ncbi:MAG: bifunctional 4-hydroxy-2-oxoglutarate aldolase/2-dehydro-3-deoxy-phosphogluconate aldolase [Treponema sp.]|nr:bifunctional 4-hydroxy-2-oxoglutarate aldolase/2-dehydro-3-deoxy-phosphogluconate aldolase [Treponema sp.]
MFEEAEKKIRDARIIPVATVSEEQAAIDLAKSLQNGGMSALEITFRTAEGSKGYEKIAQCISAVRRSCPGLTVGAGTVLNAGTASLAEQAGAQFLVSPGFNSKTVEWCLKRGVPIVPGVCTPSEIEHALEFGLTFLKLFPAEVCGGTRLLKALAGPFPQVSFLPTGGINGSNFESYLSCRNTGAVGGSWMCPESLAAEKKWREIEERCQEITARIRPECAFHPA